MKKEINVIVAGKTAAGKSTIILTLIKALKKYGVEITLDSIDYDNSVDVMEETMEHTLSIEDRLSIIGKDLKVNIKEQQIVTNKK